MIWSVVFSAALAQDPAGGFDAHGLRFASPSGDLRGPVQFSRPGDVRQLDWAAAVLAEYASRPLVFRLDGVDSVALEQLWVANVGASFAPLDRVRVDVAVPFFLSSSDGQTRGGPTTGDVRASLLLAAITPGDDGGFGLGLSAAADLPTGDPSRYLGTPGIAGQVGLTSTIEAGQVSFSALLGARLAPNTRPEERPAVSKGGDTFEGAAHLGVVVGGSSSLGLEAQLSVAIDPVVRAATGVPVTVLAYTRHSLDGGNYLSAGIGTGIGGGAGASPIRLVVGAGFGGPGDGGSAPRDRDLDGRADREDTCPQEAENVNDYLDLDGCPDVWPEVVFVVQRDGALQPDAPLVVTGPNGEKLEGVGRVAVQALPGTMFTAHTDAPSCFGATVQAAAPAAGSAEVAVPIGREDGQLSIAVTDIAGRALPGAEARYLLSEEDAVCEPASTALVDGKAVHQVGATSFTLFLTAPGYGVQRTAVTLAGGETRTVTAQLAPTQVVFRDGEIRFGAPVRFADRAKIDAAAAGLLGQLVSVLLVHDDLVFDVYGYGDGSLGKARAEAVVAWLVAAGVPADRLVASGKGAAPAGQKGDLRVVPHG